MENEMFSERRDARRRFFWGLALMLPLCAGVRAQTVDDGIMMGKEKLCTGVLYTHDSWDHYWEGTLNRVNGNLGTVTTQTVLWAGNYGVTNRLNVIANVPYVFTNASQGVLHGQKGFQDFMLAAKYKVIQIPVKQFGSLRGIAVLSGSVPMSNYTPDLLPLSIGLHSKRLTGRATVNFLGKQGLYVNGSAAYTFRGNVTLDRSSYYTNGQLYLSNEVAMPNVFDYNVSAGYRKNDMTLVGVFSQQQTRGGGDIRRQDSPFVSNRMNSSRAGVTVVIPIPKARKLQYWLMYMNTFDGRNVGQANTLTSGLMYTFSFEKRARP
jgi:hypothetical protein